MVKLINIFSNFLLRMRQNCNYLNHSIVLFSFGWRHAYPTYIFIYFFYVK
jgi:hypothetical protein